MSIVNDTSLTSRSNTSLDYSGPYIFYCREIERGIIKSVFIQWVLIFNDDILFFPKNT